MRSERKFTGTVAVEGAVPSDGDSIKLHSKDLVIESVTFDGKAAKWQAGEHDELIIKHPDITPGRHVVTITYSGKITDSMHGLYPCYFNVEGEDRELLATQFESHHAREVLPCIDEPEAKATFDLTLATETGVTVLGNMPIVTQREENDQLITKFDTSPRMSTYLLAFVVGELHCKTATTKSGIEVNVWATAAQRPESLDFALDHTIKTIDFFEEYFDTPYPLPKSDQVALPDFSSGAMENWGLVTYREVALLADPATTTIAGKQRIAEVISHELSHQWFGNLVTMKWWNNLWLNESFATLMAYVAVDAIWPEWEVWLEFAAFESVIALRRDAIDGVQSVQTDVNHPDEISSLFDGAIVYAKGARLLRMLQVYIGDEAFRAGLKSYFEEFAYRNTEADDLWRHLANSSGKDISDMMNAWISQSGYPVVHVTPEGLSQEQFFIGPHQPSQKLWPIPLGPESQEDMPSLLDTIKLSFPISDQERLNTDGSAHFITHYTPQHLKNLLDSLTNIDAIGRMQLIHEQTLLARGGIISSDQLIDTLLAYQDETNHNVWDMIAMTFGELKKFVHEDEAAENKLRELAGEIAHKEYERLGWQFSSQDSESDVKLRSTILGLMVYSERADVLQEVDQIYTAGIESIHPEIRSLVTGSVVKRSEGSSLVAELLDLLRTTPSADLREDLSDALTGVKQPEQINLLLDQFTKRGTIKPQDLFRWFAYMMRNRYARQATWQWMVDNWDWIIDNFGGDKSYDDFPRYSAAGLLSRDELDRYRDFFTPLLKIPALTRTIELGIREVEGRLELIERDGAAVRNRLTK